MNVLFVQEGWDDFLHWHANDPKRFKKVVALINDARRSPFKGLGKPEPLKEDRSGWWSRRIDDEHRLVYRVIGTGDGQRIEIAQCRYHY